MLAGQLEIGGTILQCVFGPPMKPFVVIVFHKTAKGCGLSVKPGSEGCSHSHETTLSKVVVVSIKLNLSKVTVVAIKLHLLKAVVTAIKPHSSKVVVAAIILHSSKVVVTAIKPHLLKGCGYDHKTACRLSTSH